MHAGRRGHEAPDRVGPTLYHTIIVTTVVTFLVPYGWRALKLKFHNLRMRHAGTTAICGCVLRLASCMLNDSIHSGKQCMRLAVILTARWQHIIVSLHF